MGNAPMSPGPSAEGHFFFGDTNYFIIGFRRVKCWSQR